MARHRLARETGRGPAAGTAVNIPVPAGTGDAEWLRAFHAVVPGVMRAFQPEVLVTQHGADSHADDPLADLNLSVDGQLASYVALRELAESAGGRWLALGGGGYSLVKVVPRAWTHLLATVLRSGTSTRHAAPAGLGGGVAAPPVPACRSPDRTCPTASRVAYDRGTPIAKPVDRSIAEVRGLIYPLYGLDPFDPRD